MAVLPENQSMDTGSNYRFSEKTLKARPPRSAFDLSHLSTMTIKNAGVVFPIALWETLPTDDFEISVRSLLRVLPQSVPMYSRQRLYIYAFYSRLADLWSGFDPFIRKGYTGDYVGVVPKLTTSNSVQGAVVSNSLGDYLQLPLGFSDFSGVVSCLPAMMYMRIWRDYFVNKNYYVNDRVIFPHDDSRFRVNDSGELESAKDENKTLKFDLISNTFGVPSYSGTTFTFGLFAHDYAQDYFTSALPWPQRGTASKLELSGTPTIESIFTGTSNKLVRDYNPYSLFTTLSSPINFNVPWHAYGEASGDNPIGLGLLQWDTSNFSYSSMNPLSSANLDSANDTFKTWLERTAKGYIEASNSQGSVQSTVTDLGISVTLNDIRKLAVEQLELERMARTDGSFAEFGLTFFGEISRDATDFRPTYIGGTYTGISFSEVLQTSQTTESTSPSGASALGQYAGHGIAADNQGYIGRCHCDDYGYIMILGCLMPDTYYFQGVPKFWTRDLQSEFFIPGREKLGMQEIRNQEIYYQNGNATVNQDLFGYQDRYDEYRYIPNAIHGQIADSSKKSFYPYTQARKFSTKPNLGKEFANASDVRKDYLVANTEDAYTAQFSIDCRAVRPLPYRSIPAEVIN